METVVRYEYDLKTECLQKSYRHLLIPLVHGLTKLLVDCQLKLQGIGNRRNTG